MEICIKWTLCRTCTCETSDTAQLQSLFSDKSLAKQLLDYSGVAVDPNDGLPDQICKDCIHSLNAAHLFLVGCKRADEQLRNVVERTKSATKDFDSKSKRSRKAESTTSDDEDTTLPTKINIESKEMNVDEPEQLDMSKEEKNSIQSAADSAAQNNEEYLLVVSNKEEDSDCNEYIMVDVGDNDNVIEESDADDDFNKKNPSVKETIERTVDLGPACESANFSYHSCTICYNSFPNKTQLKNHVRKHCIVKNYECELCSKRFNAACNLTTHMRTHTGEKPFVCNYCGRRFADRSTHRKHERMHTNERPYACDICGKTFSLSTTLKAHALTHTKEKPHKCLTCKKGFRLPHQLKAHEKTHTHRYEVSITYDDYNQDEDDSASS